MHLLLLALLSLAALFTGRAVQAQGQAEAERKVTAFVLEDWRITNLPMPQDFTYTMTLVDLNGDGIEEALVVYNHPTSCGSRGCSAFVLDLSGTQACSRGDFIAFSLEAGSGTKGGWRDVVLNGATSIPFNNGHYGNGSWDC